MAKKICVALLVIVAAVNLKVEYERVDAANIAAMEPVYQYDHFRETLESCHGVVIAQGTTETVAQALERMPHHDACLIFRRAPNYEKVIVPSDFHDVLFAYGTFIGNSKE